MIQKLLPTKKEDEERVGGFNFPNTTFTYRELSEKDIQIIEETWPSRVYNLRPGTPCSYSYYIHKKITYAECMRTERIIYHYGWRRLTHVSWIMSMPMMYVLRMIDQGSLYMVRKNKSGRRVV